MIDIYHNPRCTTSRKALDLIQEKGLEVNVIKYLTDTPDRDTFEKILAKLNLKPADVLRKRERIYKEHYADKQFTDSEWITIMLENPKLIERPIIVKGHKAVIARPMENLIQLLNS